jgi:hypothetical protein
MQPEKQFDEEDYLYEDNLYYYLGGYDDEQFLSDPHISQGTRRSISIRLGWLRLTGRQERWSSDFHRISENHPSGEHLLHHEYRDEQYEPVCLQCNRNASFPVSLPVRTGIEKS